MGMNSDGSIHKQCVVCGESLGKRAKSSVCSVACGLVDMIPNKSGEPLPASWWLTLVVGVYFLLFNQLLTASIVWKRVFESPPSEAEVFARISLLFGLVAAAFFLFVYLKVRIFQKADFFVGALAAVLIAVPWSELILGLAIHGFSLQLAFGNLLLGVWTGRRLTLLRT